MSGGHWNYSHDTIRSNLREIGDDGQMVLRFPKLAQTFRDFAELFCGIVHDLDWDFSGDASITNDLEF